MPKKGLDFSGGRGDFAGGTGKLHENWPQKGTSTDWAMAPERDEQLPDYDAATWAVGHLQEKHDNTLVVLWSDHGYHIGEKNTFQKHSLWERASHVPLVFAGPGIPQGKRCRSDVGLIDIYPTLLELCGLPKNKKNEGRSLLPLIKNPEKKWPYPVVTGWKENSFALQKGRYRYLRYGDGSEELYDHQNDLPEWHNLAAEKEMTTIKKNLAAQLATFLEKKKKSRFHQ